MWVVFTVLVVSAEAILVLFLILHNPSSKPLGSDLRIFALFLVAGGIVLLFLIHYNWGYLGPINSLVYISTLIRMPGEKIFWGFLNPILYNSIFAFGLIAGGAGLLRAQRWARNLLIWLAVVAAIFSMVTLIFFGKQMGEGLKSVTFLYNFSALIIVVFLLQPRIKHLFSRGPDPVEKRI